MGFLIKKVLQILLLPHTLLFLLFVLSFILVVRKNRWGKRLLLVGICLFYLLSIRPVSDMLQRGLERRYPPLSFLPAEIDDVVVLAGGTRNPGTDLAVANRLAPATLARLVEGIRLFRGKSEGFLVLSGGGFWGRPLPESSGKLMAETAVLLGIGMDRIVLEPASLDTADQAEALAGILGDRSFALVTSAFHMPRAVKLFRRLGMDPMPAPCDFRSFRGKAVAYDFFDFVPHPDRMTDTLLAVKEYYALLFTSVFR